MPPPPPDDLVTLKEAARLKGCYDDDTVRCWVRGGRLAGYPGPAGRAPLVSRADLLALPYRRRHHRKFRRAAPAAPAPAPAPRPTRQPWWADPRRFGCVVVYADPRGVYQPRKGLPG